MNLSKWWRRKNEEERVMPLPDAKEFRPTSGDGSPDGNRDRWGHALWLMSRSPRYRVVGWLHTKPRKGDLLILSTNGAVEQVWVFGEIEHAARVPDQFFATVHHFGIRERRGVR